MSTQFLGYLTVSSLLKKLNELEKKGFGNRLIVVSSDDEGNDYGELLDQEVLTDKEDIEEYLGEYDSDKNCYDMAYHCYHSPEEIIVL